MTEWTSLFATLGLIGVTVWYAIHTQSMARSARDSAISAREAAQHSARSAAVAAAATDVDFWIGPTYAIADADDEEGVRLSGVRVECAGAAVFVHSVKVDSLYAPDPDYYDIEPSLTEKEIFPSGAIPGLLGLGSVPMLMHKGEFAFLEFPRPSWSHSEVCTMTVTVNYSFDGQQPLRSRRIEWIGRLGRDYGPVDAADGSLD